MRWVIAGGGTGGHLFPGIAIAEAFIEREMGNEVLFIGTERGIEARILPGGKFPLKTIQAAPLKGRSFLTKIKTVWKLPAAISEAYSILKGFEPQLVLGVGGYSSGPTLLAASLLGTKRAIHEQNVIPGMTNRILKWFSQRIFVSFEETKEYFPEKKTIVTGNPIRKEIAAFLLSGETGSVEGRERRTADRFTLLIFGGSAGAHRINQAMMEALRPLQEIRSRLRIFHQTGREDIDWVSKTYQEQGFEALVKPFFEDMATRYQLSDLVISRSGASTIAELAACRKAAILVPYPYAANNHQVMNAKGLASQGTAIMILDGELSGATLSQAILRLYGHPEERAMMGEKMGLLARPNAAQEIVDHCYGLLGRTMPNVKAQRSTSQ